MQFRYSFIYLVGFIFIAIVLSLLLYQYFLPNFQATMTPEERLNSFLTSNIKKDYLLYDVLGVKAMPVNSSNTAKYTTEYVRIAWYDNGTLHENGFATDHIGPEPISPGPQHNVTPTEKNVVGMSWKLIKTNFTALLIRNSNNNNVKELRAVIESSGAVNPPPNTLASNTSFIPLYLKDPGVNWKCVNLVRPRNGLMCESFSEGKDGKLGKSLLVLDKNVLLIVCQFPKGSESYAKTSCTS